MVENVDRQEVNDAISRTLRNRAHFDALLRKELTDRDFTTILALMLREAKKGERWAIREILDRLIGKAITPVEIQEAPPVKERPYKTLAEIMAPYLDRALPFPAGLPQPTMRRLESRND
jgi:hypothetical protein